MSKNKIIQVLIICSVFFSFLACFLIYRYMAPSRGTIYLFNAAYKAGEQVRSEMFVPIQVDAKMVIAGKKSQISEQFVTPSMYQAIVKSGDSLRMDVGKGMPFMISMLSVAGGSSVEMLMKSDAVAVTIPVDPFTGVTSDLKEGAKVNIYANMDSQTTLIQQNKRVLEVYKENGEITGAAIEETIQESMELIYAASYGKIYLGLVDGTGYQAVEGTDLIYSPYLDNMAAWYGENEKEVSESRSTEIKDEDFTEDMETESETSETGGEQK